MFNFFKASIYLLPLCLNTRAFLTKDTGESLAWLRYWIIYSLLFALEILLDFHRTYFPCYESFKVGLLWLCIATIVMNMSASGGGKNLSQVENRLIENAQIEKHFISVQN